VIGGRCRVTELCFNLWYYLASDQTIRALSARAYLLSGDEKEKGQVLAGLSTDDWRLVPAQPVPEEVRNGFGGEVPYWALKRLGVEAVFVEEFRRLRRELPVEVVFPDEKLYFATPLFDFGEGFTPAEIGDGYIRSR
jgi:hypothetical protein